MKKKITDKIINDTEERGEGINEKRNYKEVPIRCDCCSCDSTPGSTTITTTTTLETDKDENAYSNKKDQIEETARTSFFNEKLLIEVQKYFSLM